MYKMHLNTVPQYLCDAIANFRENVQYNTRNEDKYIDQNVDYRYPRVLSINWPLVGKGTKRGIKSFQT